MGEGKYKVRKQVSYSGAGEEQWKSWEERIEHSKKHPHTTRPYEPFSSAKYKAMEQKLINDEKFVSLKNTLASSESLSLSDKKALYKQYYLDKLAQEDLFPREVINSLERMYEKYNVPVFLDKDLDPMCALMIENELSAWTSVSGGNAKLPTIIDTSTINAEYYKRGTLGYVQRDRNNMSLNGDRGVVRALRHELTHLNDKISKGHGWFGENEQYDFIADGSILKNKKWYREELINAGITNEFDLDYAYTNKMEFIAIASEGNLKAYSAEFKQVLIELGMPEWLFELPC